MNDLYQTCTLILDYQQSTLCDWVGLVVLFVKLEVIIHHFRFKDSGNFSSLMFFVLMTEKLKDDDRLCDCTVKSVST